VVTISKNQPSNLISRINKLLDEIKEDEEEDPWLDKVDAFDSTPRAALIFLNKYHSRLRDLLEEVSAELEQLVLVEPESAKILADLSYRQRILADCFVSVVQGKTDPKVGLALVELSREMRIMGRDIRPSQDELEPAGSDQSGFAPF